MTTHKEDPHADMSVVIVTWKDHQDLDDTTLVDAIRATPMILESYGRILNWNSERLLILRDFCISDSNSENHFTFEILNSAIVNVELASKSGRFITRQAWHKKFKKTR